MEKIQTHLIGKTLTSNSKSAYQMSKKSYFGEKVGEKIQYMPTEAFYLFEKNQLEIFQKSKKLPNEEIVKKLQKIDKKFQEKYIVFKDLRKKGYIVKTALKFGAEFRVYSKGKKPGQEHAKWLVITEKESNKINWHEFSSKNRVAHSTKKNLLLGLIDEEGKVIYYEISWIKP
ncbi:MAG: tRNA-intron lyase [Nanoarchaeota archaeon]|nr:tRNA-intron lyase [Nanoarchaeota archaeon]